MALEQSYVYILFSQRNGTLYTGVISNLTKRVYEHKNKIFEGFSKKYDVDKLGYFEIFDNIEYAILREKRIKKMYRKEKLALIEKDNPNWLDLYESIL